LPADARCLIPSAARVREAWAAVSGRTDLS
jgi:hypothetical protein